MGFRENLLMRGACFIVVALLVLALLVELSVQQDDSLNSCERKTSCKKCIEKSTCVWCADRKKCEKANARCHKLLLLCCVFSAVAVVCAFPSFCGRSEACAVPSRGKASCPSGTRRCGSKRSVIFTRWRLARIRLPVRRLARRVTSCATSMPAWECG